MLQRLQTIYFIAIILICSVLFGGSIINVHSDINGKSIDYTLNLLYFNTYENSSLVSSSIQYELIALAALVIVWVVKVIRSYNDRMQQIQHAKKTYLFLLILGIAVFAKAAMKIPGFNMSGLNSSSIFGLALFLFTFYLNWRAISMIKRDEEAVRSADRLR